MHEWHSYSEPADEDTEGVYLGDVQAGTMSEALDLAAQNWEYRRHDLVAVQIK